ncbi:hypothetical protein LOTGIDRAFT_183459 [Lottia gigantea]|uniref:Beta-mannosidase n=1 Tax=Lottia gigantea TaxID=225164 RepID=V3Z851_LOTGI|nr:hypothetical protein LOTGIDRAFT_183459 [Lottia gigantea]ESO87028.1 hypothetical protein LOTGIDRAFT_183459 [Lottia gigantea]
MSKCWCVCVLFSLFSSVTGINQKTLDLNGRWDIINVNKGYRISGEVPGSVYTALIGNKTIGDPYFRDNDVQYRWIGRDDWTYTRLFEISDEVMSKQAVVLVAEGLDTFSLITVNGVKIGESENMFLRYVFDVKKALKSGLNNITIDFKSAVNIASQLNNQSAYTIPPSCPNIVQNGECFINFIRKEQCSFSWNWAPSFPTQGIWRNISIQYFDEAVVRGLSAVPILDADQNWVIHITLHLDISSQNISGLVETTLDKINLSHVHLLSSPVYSDIYFNFNVPKGTHIDLWWPNGYGEQALYNLTVKFVTFDKKQIMAQTSTRIGFRSLELVQEPVSDNSSHGVTFYFKINNVPIFFKGTNWVPADSFLERVTKTRLERLLRSAVEVHINSMRVWGGGVYESEEFYGLCDELGIMLWHDLMFSDALYPSTKEFLASVQNEINHQVRRLKTHPSIILWSGNNENNEILNEYQGDQYKKDYLTLYIDTIKPVVTLLDPSRPFVSSSPSNGPETEKEGWIAKNPQSDFFGDVHFYNDSADLWDISVLDIPRFASEFGTESWCNFETIEKVLSEADLSYNSPMSLHRQHNVGGNEIMLNLTKIHIQLPNSTNPKQQFEDLIYVIQIHHAVAMRTEIEHYRRWTNQLQSDGRGHTMGALYWQLNDIWQGPSWSSIDYDIKWKMLHYYARKFFDPNLISPYVDEDTLKVFLKSILASEGTLYMDLYTWKNMTPIKSWEKQFNLNETSGCIFQNNLDNILSDAGCKDKRDCFFYFSLNSKVNPTSTSWLPLAYFTDIQGRIPKSNIKIVDVAMVSSTEFLLTLSTDNIAPFVWIDSRGISGRFSDNGFIMKDSLLQLTYKSWDSVDLATFQKSLSVKSLMDIY